MERRCQVSARRCVGDTNCSYQRKLPRRSMPTLVLNPAGIALRRGDLQKLGRFPLLQLRYISFVQEAMILTGVPYRCSPSARTIVTMVDADTARGTCVPPLFHIKKNPAAAKTSRMARHQGSPPMFTFCALHLDSGWYLFPSSSSTPGANLQREHMLHHRRVLQLL